MSDDYRTVTTRFRGISESGQAFRVDLPHGRGTAWILRLLIHAADDAALGKLDATECPEITFRLRDWKGEELGFA